MIDDKLSALRRVVDAKGAYWTAMRELETALGYDDDVPDNVSDYLVYQVENMAGECDSSAWIDEAEYLAFEKGLPSDPD